MKLKSLLLIMSLVILSNSASANGNKLERYCGDVTSPSQAGTGLGFLVLYSAKGEQTYIDENTNISTKSIKDLNLLSKNAVVCISGHRVQMPNSMEGIYKFVNVDAVTVE